MISRQMRAIDRSIALEMMAGMVARARRVRLADAPPIVGPVGEAGARNLYNIREYDAVIEARRRHAGLDRSEAGGWRPREKRQ